jgi:cysteine desulfurase/selenocysteine lyase
MIYFDNAATSYPKPDIVLKEINRCMSCYCANPGRGGHEMAIFSAKAINRSREVISSFFNIKNPMQLCFTKNATEALNMGIKGILRCGAHVLTTSMEHNSVIRPLKTLEKKGDIELTIIKADRKGYVNANEFNKKIKKNTRLIVCTLSSNVNGMILPVKEIGEVARNCGIVFLVDGSQGAGSIVINVEEMNIDMLAFPGHKGLLGPQGTGGLYVRDGLKVSTIVEGGTGSQSENIYQPELMPDALESGTLNTPGIIGLSSGINFINEYGINNIRLYKHLLVKRFIDGVSDIKGVILYSSDDMEENSGIVALNIEGMDSTEVSHILDKKFKIATRAGFHCAPLAHKTLGTFETGVVRFSFGCFNTIDEIDYTIDALKEISAKGQNYTKCFMY